MGPTDSKQIQGLHLGQANDIQFKYSENGLRFQHRFSEVGKNPFDMVEYEKRTSVIREPDGTVIFEMKDIEIPKGWSQVATDILAQKYFRKTGVPQYNENGSPKLNADGSVVLGSETSAKQIMHRLAGTWRFWAEKYGYFATAQDAQIFYDELVVMLLKQMASPNSPQWFNTGLHWAYGINSGSQGHYYVSPDTGVMTKSEDAYSHPQPHACGRYDTKLFTEKGILNLGEIVEKELLGLKVFDGERFVKIQAVKNNGIKKLFCANLRNGNYIEFTDDHLVLAADKRAKDGGIYDWQELANIVGNKVQQVALDFTDKLDQVDQNSVDKAALAGFVVGDGYYGKYNRNNKTILFGVITINDDEYNEVTRLFSNIFGKYKVRIRKDVGDLYRIITFDSKEADSFVEAYELNQSSYTAKVPEIIMQSSKAEKVAFLCTLFQADGCVRKRTDEDRNSGDIVLTSISEELVHGVQTLLLELGIYSNVTRNNEKRENRKDNYQLSISYFSERKKYQQLIGFISEDKVSKLGNLNSEVDGKNKEALSEETVISIEYIDEEEVYDIQTESGQFSANGVVVHNCFIQSVRDDLVNEGGIMDLWVREARLFKYGSGTGTNFSALRASGESLSGGGRSSGLMSWLKIGDRSAGAIKSGGTTRRAAKMAILDIDHPDIEEFIQWKVNEEKKVAALIAAGYPSDYEGEAYQTVSGQNSNNSVRITHKFMEAMKNNGTWNLTARTDGSTMKIVKAREMWNKIAYAAWACADPGVQYDGTINNWHTCPQSGKINASNPCSEYMFLDNTACNLASLNLDKFFNNKEQTFLVDDFKQAVRLWTIVLEISVLMAQFPSKEIAQGSYDFRTLGLGYANLGSILMTSGLPYDSETGYAFAASVTALMTAESYKTSAEMAKFLGPFPKFELNRADMLRVIRNHRRAAFNASQDEYEKLVVKPQGIDPAQAPAYLLAAVRESWNEALEMGEKYGFRNAQTTLLAPTGTIGLQMDCATTGVEPDFALVKFKKLAGGGYFRIVNEAIPDALQNLGYSEDYVQEILDYMKGTADITGAPHINAESLKGKGFNDEDLENIHKALKGAFEIKFIFNIWTLGEDCLQRIGFKPEEYNAPDFNMLKALGFSEEQIEEANEYICGTMTIEGAPHLQKEHYPIFDCANKCGKKGERFIYYLGHIKMMAAVQPFLSGAISKTINMPNNATVDDVKLAYDKSWQLGLKAVAIYRDGCKLSQPLATTSKNKGDEKEVVEEPEVEAIVEKVAQQTVYINGNTEVNEAMRQAHEILQQYLPQSQPMDGYDKDGTIMERRIYLHGEKRKLPAKRSGITVSSRIGQQKVWLRTGEYPDGRLAEVFIDMYKEGAAFRSMLNLFAISVSMGLQYGVPLEKYVEKFTFTRFDPAGFTDHPNVRNCTSVIDFVFRILGMEYLGRTDFVQVPPKGIQKKKFENLAKLAETQNQQETMELKEEAGDAVIQVEKVPDIQAILPSLETKISMPSATNASLSDMMGDAPACPTCGHITVRNGSCYKCLNCGDSLGCS